MCKQLILNCKDIKIIWII